MKEKKCFVIMPMSKTKSCNDRQWKKIYEEMIKPAVTGCKLGLECERSRARTGSIVKDILNQLNVADIVIADLTDMNPNVFYELGVRHTLRNRTILITQDIKYVPFDLKPYGVITYVNNANGFSMFKAQIRQLLRSIYDKPDRPDNPVADFIQDKSILLASQEKLTNAKKLAALIAEFSQNISIADEIVAKITENGELQKQGTRGKIPIRRLRDDCIGLILTTAYIAVNTDSLRKMYNANAKIADINRMLDCCIQESLQSGAETVIARELPLVKIALIELLKIVGTIRKDYMNDNYQEPPSITILLGDKTHSQYIESTVGT